MGIEIPFFRQEQLHHCGPAVVRMVLHFYGGERLEQEIADAMGTTEEEGTPLSSILDYVKSQGLRVIHKDGADFSDIQGFIDQGYPVMVNYRETSQEQGHFALVVEITEEEVILNDPWHGSGYAVDKEEFRRRWHNEKKTRERTIVAILPKADNSG